MFRYRRHGFTLVELLVVIAIIGILIALLLPAVQAAREAARRNMCSNNLKQISMGLLGYHDVYQRFPYGAATDYAGGPAYWTWSVYLLPYIEQGSLYDQLDLEIEFNWAHPSNNQITRQLLAAYQCPSAEDNALLSCCIDIKGNGTFTDEQDVAETSYAAIATHRQVPRAMESWDPSHPDADKEPTGIIYMNSKISIRDITDGTSHTLVVSECDYDNENDPLKNTASAYCPNKQCLFGKWWAGQNMITTGHGINPGPEWAHIDGSVVQSSHPGVAGFAFSDGHVDFLPETIEQGVLEALTTRNWGEVIGADAY